jgi:hypothetical protein
MGWKRKFGGGFIGFIGFLLSPLSWWNDAFVNLPLAYGFASGMAWFHRPAFATSFVIGYWLTNVLGLVLLQKGLRQATSSAAPRRYTRRDLIKDLAVSLLYTALIVVLLQLKVLQPIGRYFGGR